MNPKEFYQLVVNMREAQKNYFGFKTQSNFNAARKLERAVDAEIRRVDEVMKKRQMENHEPKIF